MARQGWKRMSNNKKAAVLDFYRIPHGLKSRAPATRVDHPDLEKHVLRACCDLLAAHPKVAFAVRQNSGGASYEHSSGDFKPIYFYEILKPSWREYTITDLWGLLLDGRPFAFECKRPSWKGATLTDREERQAAFIRLIRARGGVGDFITDAEQINALLA